MADLWREVRIMHLGCHLGRYEARCDGGDAIVRGGVVLGGNGTMLRLQCLNAPLGCIVCCEAHVQILAHTQALIYSAAL